MVTGPFGTDFRGMFNKFRQGLGQVFDNASLLFLHGSKWNQVRPNWLTTFGSSLFGNQATFAANWHSALGGRCRCAGGQHQQASGSRQLEESLWLAIACHIQLA